MRITTTLIFAAALAACGGKLAPTPTSTSPDDDGASAGGDRGGSSVGDASLAPPSGFDDGGSSSFGDGGAGPGFPPVPNGPSDTSPECSTRVATDCCSGESCPKDANAVFGEMLDDCAMKVGYCGLAYADLDAQGCAYSLRLDEADAYPKFGPCVTSLLNAARFACVDGPVELEGFVDCTVPR